MGLLDRALSFAKSAYDYVVGNDTPKTATAEKCSNNAGEVKKQNAGTSKKTVPNSAVRPKGELVGTVGDVVVKKPQAKAKQVFNAIVTQQDLDKKLLSIKNKCGKYNIDYKEAEKNILSNMDFSVEEYNKLSNSKKLSVLNAIDSTLSSYIIEKYKDDENVDVTALIGQSAKNLEMAVNEGGIKSGKEFRKYTKQVNLQMVQQLRQAKTEEEKIKIITEFRQEFRANIENERQEALKKCKTEQEIAKVNFRYDKRIEALESQNALEFAADHGPENAYLSTYFVSGKNYGKANINSIRMFKGDAKTEAANSYTHQRRIDALKTYYEMGDPISAEVYGEAIKYTSQFMSEDVLEKYEFDAYNYRLEHKDNLPEYITQEHLTEESAAIGVGAMLNENLTAEAKAKFLKTWDEHAKQFDDYDEVRGKYYRDLKEYAEKHPEIKTNIEEVKTKYKELYESSFDMPRAALKRYASSELSAKTEKGNEPDTKFNPVESKNIKKSKEKEEKIVDPIEVREKILSGELRTDEDIKNALNQSNYEFAVFLAKDPILRVIKKNSLTEYIINENPNNGNLQALAQRVPVIIDLIMNNMRGDKQMFVKDLISHNKVSHDIKKHIEKEIESVA